MRACTYCKGELGPDEQFSHRVCVAEDRRRADAGLCTVCGVNPPKQNWLCEGCIAQDDPPYQNYPGGN